MVLVADDPLEGRISFWTGDDVALPQMLCQVFSKIGRDLEDEKRQEIVSKDVGVTEWCLIGAFCSG